MLAERFYLSLPLGLFVCLCVCTSILRALIVCLSACLSSISTVSHSATGLSHYQACISLARLYLSVKPACIPLSWLYHSVISIYMYKKMYMYLCLPGYFCLPVYCIVYVLFIDKHIFTILAEHICSIAFLIKPSYFSLFSPPMSDGKIFTNNYNRNKAREIAWIFFYS